MSMVEASHPTSDILLQRLNEKGREDPVLGNQPIAEPERKQLNEALLRSVLENMSDAFYALDDRLHLTYVNQRACKHWNRQTADLIGRSITEVRPDIVLSEEWNLLEAVLTTGRPAQAEVHSVLTGHWLFFAVHPAPTGGVTVYFRDISEAKEKEEALRESDAQVKASEERLRQVTDNLPVLIAYVDAEERYQFNNRAYETWMGRSPESMRGAHLKDVLGWMRYEAIKPFVQAALAGQRIGYESWVELPDGKRYVKTEYIPDTRVDGRVGGFYVLVSDITAFWHSQHALAQSEARLRLALDAGRMAIWETETATDTIVLNPALNRLLGIPANTSLTEDEIQARYYPGVRGHLRAAAEEALARGQRYVESELRVVGYDSGPRWLLLRAELKDIRDGKPMRILGVALDITERKKAEEHQRLLLNELNHRVKNTLATVQSIAAQSLRNAQTSTEARQAIEGRLLALSRVHDVLTRENWDGASLNELVQEAIAPFQSSEQGRFSIQGQDVRLSPRIALSLAMALQELGTNAVKYGALCSENGRVEIGWTLVDMAEGSKLEMIWREIGGPTVLEPTRKGFGTRLIERSLAQELHGSVSIAFAPTGVICSIQANLSGSRSAGPAKSDL